MLTDEVVTTGRLNGQLISDGPGSLQVNRRMISGQEWKWKNKVELNNHNRNAQPSGGKKEKKKVPEEKIPKTGSSRKNRQRGDTVTRIYFTFTSSEMKMSAVPNGRC